MWKLVAVLKESQVRAEWAHLRALPQPEDTARKDLTMRSILLWLIGIPIPIIILIALFYR